MLENRIKKFRFIGTLKLLQIFGGPHASRVRVSPFVGILALLLFVAETKGYRQSNFRRVHENVTSRFSSK